MSEEKEITDFKVVEKSITPEGIELAGYLPKPQIEVLEFHLAKELRTVEIDQKEVVSLAALISTGFNNANNINQESQQKTGIFGYEFTIDRSASRPGAYNYMKTNAIHSLMRKATQAIEDGREYVVKFEGVTKLFAPGEYYVDKYLAELTVALADWQAAKVGEFAKAPLHPDYSDFRNYFVECKYGIWEKLK